MASKAVRAARARRQANSGSQKLQDEWYINDVASKINMTMKQRIQLATEWVKNKVVENISIPVERIEGGAVIRSEPGEFPRADTTQLMKTIYMEVREIQPDVWDGWVGTPLDYGLILETRMDRSFLVRTFVEEASKVQLILNGPII